MLSAIAAVVFTPCPNGSQAEGVGGGINERRLLASVGISKNGLTSCARVAEKRVHENTLYTSESASVCPESSRESQSFASSCRPRSPLSAALLLEDFSNYRIFRLRSEAASTRNCGSEIRPRWIMEFRATKGLVYKT